MHGKRVDSPRITVILHGNKEDIFQVAALLVAGIADPDVADPALTSGMDTVRRLARSPNQQGKQDDRRHPDDSIPDALQNLPSLSVASVTHPASPHSVAAFRPVLFYSALPALSPRFFGS